MKDATTKIEGWRQDHNANHPHRALKGLSPDECATGKITTAPRRYADFVMPAYNRSRPIDTRNGVTHFVLATFYYAA